jgi:two-component system, sensor histidine kinase
MVPMTPMNEPERLIALSECDVLDTAPEADFDNLTRLAAGIAGCPIAYVALVDSDRQWFKSKLGLSTCQTSRDIAFCAHVVASGTPMVIEDATLDDRFANNPLVTSDPRIRFYAGFPLTLSDGTTVGTFCVADTTPRRLSEQQFETLTNLAGQARSQLELRRAVHHLRKTEKCMRVSHDLLVRSHEDLEIEHERAQAAAKAKSAFLMNMSHEIRTPMTAIIGFTDLLTSTPSAEERAEHVEVIRRSARHLLGLIDDVLEVASLDSDGLTLSMLECDPRRVLAEVEGQARALAREKRLTFSSACDPNVRTKVKTDPNRLRQIILYLTANAVKFTESGSVRVEMNSLDGGAPDRAILRVRVTDSGVGIAPETLAALFRPFAVGDATTTRRYGGTGLGLYVAKRLCRLMGGDLTVASELGRGSTFTATVEIGVVTPRTAPRSVWHDAPAVESDGLRSAHVLVVEDGLDNQRLLKSFLTKAGAQVTIASDGQEALDVVLQGNGMGTHNLIVMDMQMPRIDGYDATRRLRQAGVLTPIIAVTAHALPGEREKCLECGCDDYQTKPIDRPALLACCERWLSRARATVAP